MVRWAVQSRKPSNLGRSRSSQELEGVGALGWTLGGSCHMSKSNSYRLYRLLRGRMVSPDPKTLEHRERCCCWLERGSGWLKRW